MTAKHVPTEEQRKTVQAFAGYGIPENDIANVLGIDPKTLRKHYRAELDTAFVQANARVAQSLFKMATEGGNVAAAIFWLKARASWTERVVIDNRHTHERPIAELTDTELADIVSNRGSGDGTAEATAGKAKPDRVH